MRREFDFGCIDFEGRGTARNRVTVEMEYKTDGEKKRFSVSANVWNTRHSKIVCCGQCLDTIAPYINNPVFSEILRLWKLYHLNDLHPECEHQAAEGWREKAAENVTLYHWRMTREARREQKATENAAISALKAGENFTPSERQCFIARLPYFLTTHTDTPPETVAKYYEPEKPLFNGDRGHTEVKKLGWLGEDEHPEGLLSKACPVCGHKYGGSWVYFPIPSNDEKIIEKLLKEGGL